MSNMCKIKRSISYLTFLRQTFDEIVLVTFADIVFVIFCGMLFVKFLNTLSVAFIMSSYTLTKV